MDVFLTSLGLPSRLQNERLKKKALKIAKFLKNFPQIKA
jgi:hypothetical protein